MGGLLVAAQIKEAIAVAHDAFPLLFVQRLDLRHVLQDDGYRHLAGAHDGEDLIEVLRQAHIGELVHDKMDMNGKPAAVFVIRRMEKLLK